MRALGFGFVLLLASEAHANPADVIGLGARAISMGGAQVATVDDSTAGYYNPARLASFDDIHIDVGYQMAVPRVGANGETFAVDRSEGLAAGLAVPGQILGKRLAIGASLFVPDQQVTRTRTLPAGRPRFLAYDNRPQRLLLAALDISYQRWSVYDNPTARIDIELDVKQFNDLVMIPPPKQLEPPNLRDIYVPRVGVEWRGQPGKRRWTARGGYVFERAVAPIQKLESNFIDNNKHTLALGGGLEWKGIGDVIQKPVSLDAFVSFTYLMPRDHHKLDPVDPVGDYTAKGHAFAAGLMSRWRF